MFILQSEYKEGKQSFEEQKDKVSLTVPDMSYKIADLLNNYTVMPEIRRPVLWSDDVSFDDVNLRLQDLTDLDEAQRELSSLNATIAAAKNPIEEPKA